MKVLRDHLFLFFRIAVSANVHNRYQTEGNGFLFIVTPSDTVTNLQYTAQRQNTQ